MAQIAKMARIRPCDSAYFGGRAVQELVAAGNAACEAARERHLELAAMYRARALIQPDRPVLATGTSVGDVAPEVA